MRLQSLRRTQSTFFSQRFSSLNKIVTTKNSATAKITLKGDGLNYKWENLSPFIREQIAKDKN